ncbi:G-protein alpha subunit [Trametes meyenii]|nr:G-protein alpha subunit [Trametes meyenii]
MASWPPSPPKTESESERAARLTSEKEAKKISDEIDRALEQERQELKKRRPQTKILLLGQSESGKSTMIKNFQLYFCPSSFHAETEAWRAVIHLTLVRLVDYLLPVLSQVNSSGDPNRDYRTLKVRLSPLKQVRLTLERCLGVETTPPATSTDDPPVLRMEIAPEISVRGGTGWKSFIRKRRGSYSRASVSPDELDGVRRILDACKNDIVALFTSPARNALGPEGVDLHHHARYFVEHAARVADIKYTPTTDDILRARIRTVGVEEYPMTMETAAEKGTEWVFYDVGGQRNQRASWASYFDDVNAMIFLCPLSGFNQRLEEDRSVNRLEDSLKLWELVCRNKLLSGATFILLLNKADLLHAKLRAGIHFSDYVLNYAREEPNTFEGVATYIQNKMIESHRRYSPRKRPLHVHITCAIVRA